MSTPSILFINRVYAPQRGATGRILRDLAEGFAEKGWSVTVLTTGDDGNISRTNGVQLHRLSVSFQKKSFLTYGWIWLRLCIAALFQTKHDIVVTMTDPPMLIIVGRLYAFFKRAKHIHWCQDLYPDLLLPFGMGLPRFLQSGMTKLSRRIMNKAARVVVVGRCMAEKLEKDGVAKKRLSFIPNWPDREILQSPPLGTTASPDEKFRILYAGTIGRGHPIKAILDALTILNESNPEIEFLFVGDDAGHNLLAKERDRRGLHNVRMIPFQPPGHLRSLMESGDVHLVSLHEDVTGLMVPSKFYSALAAERPCVYIGPPQTEIARAIKDHHCGVLIQNKDGKGLAQAILHYRNDSDAWLKAQEGAREAKKIFLPGASIKAFIKRAGLTRQGG